MYCREFTHSFSSYILPWIHPHAAFPNTVVGLVSQQGPGNCMKWMMNDVKPAHSTVRAILHVPLVTHAAAASYKQEVFKAATDCVVHPPFHMVSSFHKVELRMAKGRKRDFLSNQIKSPSSAEMLCKRRSPGCAQTGTNGCMRSGRWVFRNGTYWLLHSGIAIHKSSNEFIKSKDDNQSLELSRFLKIKFCSLSRF